MKAGSEADLTNAMHQVCAALAARDDTASVETRKVVMPATDSYLVDKLCTERCIDPRLMELAGERLAAIHKNIITKNCIFVFFNWNEL